MLSQAVVSDMGQNWVIRWYNVPLNSNRSGHELNPNLGLSDEKSVHVVDTISFQKYRIGILGERGVDVLQASAMSIVKDRLICPVS